MGMYNIKLKRTFLFTVNDINAEDTIEAQEKAWEYLERGEVSFDDVIDKVSSIEAVVEVKPNVTK
jgi:hypothetical protein